MSRYGYHKPETFISAAQRPTWMAEGACLDHHPELWYSDRGDAANAAKQICASCPVKALCLQWAIETSEPDGIWGGRTFKERSNLRRAANYAARKATAA